LVILTGDFLIRGIIINMGRSGELVDSEEFLRKKKDYSKYLIHLTRGRAGHSGSKILNTILYEKTLRAYQHHCYFDKNLALPDSVEIKDQFKVICFTETPLGQIDALLQPLLGRWNQPEPYGLVFEKKFIREMGGNPVFYVTRDVALPLWQLYWKVKKNEFHEKLHKNACRTLALVTLCDDRKDAKSDWHWEREWRIVGDFHFGLDQIYCGICPESEIPYFETNYRPVRFIDPYWRHDRIVDEIVKKKVDDIPF